MKTLTTWIPTSAIIPSDGTVVEARKGDAAPRLMVRCSGKWFTADGRPAETPDVWRETSGPGARG